MSLHLITTRAVEDTCKCGSLIMAGHAEGLFVRVDVKPVDRAAEIVALLDGRRTFALVVGQLVHRDPGRIRGGLTGAGLYVEHRCAIPYVQPSLIGAIA